MAMKLRTRLFLVVGALLAASILVSACLSRQLTLVEVRGDESGDQSSGRLVTIPNFKILTEAVFNFTTASPLA